MIAGGDNSHRNVDDRLRSVRKRCATADSAFASHKHIINVRLQNHKTNILPAQQLLLLFLLHTSITASASSSPFATQIPTVTTLLSKKNTMSTTTSLMLRRILFPSTSRLAFATTNSLWKSSLPSFSSLGSSSSTKIAPLLNSSPMVSYVNRPTLPLSASIMTSSALPMAAAEIGSNRRLRQSPSSSSSSQTTKRQKVIPNDQSSDNEDQTHNNESTGSDNNINNNNNTNESEMKQKPKKDPANTGRLRLLPQLPQPSEILSRAARHADREAGDNFGASIANKRLRAHKRGALCVDLFVQGLCSPLKEVVKTYNDDNASRRLHPFERVVLELALRSREKTGGNKSVSTSLHEIHESRKELLQLSKDWIAKIKATTSAGEAYDCTNEARKAISQTFLDMIVEPWSAVSELQKSLRNVPVVRLDCPAVVLVGAPNVGKSSIVRAISSGTPEVNNYPFTTRGVTLGHVRIFWENESAVSSGKVAGASVPKENERYLFSSTSKKKKGSSSSSSDSVFPISQLCQIMDSPGVLRRDASESRNEMEELTLAAMSHLPTAVVYVMDLSGGAGDRCSSVEDQLILRRELRSRYPRRPWIDVLSKSDLGVIDGARERLVHIIESERRQILHQQGQQQQQQQQHQQRSGGGEGRGSMDTSDRYFIELSIKEGQGVDELRQEVMRMLGEVRLVLDAMAAMDNRSARSN